MLPKRHLNEQAIEVSADQAVSGGKQKLRVIISFGSMETNSVTEALLLDIWQKIPPEEKKELASRAQSTAISTVLVVLMLGWAMAVGMREQWYFWGTFLIVPIAFQVATSKAWHALKPKLIVEYTAARATACFYAQQAKAAHMVPSVQFKGLLERQFSDDQQSESDISPDSAEEPRGPVSVWVTLFPDSLVMFSETPFGSQREFAHALAEDLSVTTEEMEDDFGDQRRLMISVRDVAGAERRWVLASKHAAQLSICQRRLLSAMERRQTLLEQASRAKQNAIKQEIQAALGA